MSTALRPAKPKEALSGQLQPGDLAYITLNKSEIRTSGINISVQFNYNGGNPILLAQQSQFPTLTDYDLKFSNGNLSATAASTYEISDDLLAGGNVILAVFNVDYHRRGEAEFEILILGEGFLDLGSSYWCKCFVFLKLPNMFPSMSEKVSTMFK